MLPSGDFYLCKTCYESAIDFVGDPTIHHWETVHVAIEGRGSDSTYVVERCRICGDLRVDDDTAVVEWITGDDEDDGDAGGGADDDAGGGAGNGGTRDDGTGDDADSGSDQSPDGRFHEPSTEPSPGNTGWE